ncbi:MAG: DUF1697 domain-containing protein [Thermoleophilia bacterium]
MPSHVAFLRGMNLGGRRIKNEELQAEFEALGFAEVACFRASGNVVFAADGSETKLVKQIETGLGEALGYEVPVFLRSAAELGALAAREPFGAAEKASEGKLQVALLPKKPAAKAREQALAAASDEDRLAIEGRELYWLPSGRMSDSELDLKLLDAALGPWTMRTMGTIEQIVAKHFS